MTLDQGRSERFARQLVIPAIGSVGQGRLAEARVRVIGASGAAAPALLYLTLAGVGTIWIDDPELVGPADVEHWVYPPEGAGQPRALVAAAALQPRSCFVRVEPWREGLAPTATLVLAVPVAQAVAAAEAARRAGLPHVVAEVDGEGGTVLTVPVGAPCFACGRSISGRARPAQPGAAALTALAAGELVLLLADPSGLAGRRIDLTRGVPSVRPTARLAGCGCGAKSTDSAQAV